MIGIGFGGAWRMDLIAGLGLAIGVSAVNETSEPTPRALTNFEVSPTSLEVWAVDGPGPGGANHRYEISGYSAPDLPERSCYTPIHFQNGPIGEVGPNGVTCESLIAICIDRLEAFERGPYANDYNAAALAHLQSALGCLFDRTRARMARNVEGTSAP